MILDYGPRELKSLQIAWCTSVLDFLFRSEHNVEWSKNTRTEFLPDENEPEGIPRRDFNKHQLQMAIRSTPSDQSL